VIYTCGYCKKTFKRENSLAVHICEKKRRHLEKDTKQNQLGFRCFQLFYKIGTNSKKLKTYEDFASSQYFSGFVKFSSYCIDLKVDDVDSYVKWLLQKGIPLNKWASDKTFNEWIVIRLKTETPARAVERTILFLEEWAKENNDTFYNYFANVNPNMAVFHVCSGKISPWILYTSDTASTIFDKLNSEQTRMITAYVDPEYWFKKLNKNTEDVNWVLKILGKVDLA
jgi:hypothetical protein